MAVFENPGILLLIPAMAVALFLIIRSDFVALKGERWKDYGKAKVRKRLVVFALRLVTLACLIAALAQPAVVKQELNSGDPVLTMLIDNSRSFDIFDREAAYLLKERLQDNIPVKARNIGSENVSAIGDEILASMTGNDNFLLVSDGRATKGRLLGDVLGVAAVMNSTINLLYLDQVRTDLSVRIEGPRVTTVGIDNEFIVTVDQAAPAAAPPSGYRLVVELDGEVVLEKAASGTSDFKFTKKLSDGYHRIEAAIEADDFFPENNVFYRSVKVEKKPKVLLVSAGNSPLETLFTPVYDLTTLPSLGGVDLRGYYAIVLNDIPASGIDADKLSAFIDDGNGAVVFGGKNSYDKGGYGNKPLEGLLPVRVGTSADEAKKLVNIVLLIDISKSTGERFGSGSDSTVEDVEKALAIGILGDLKPDDRVAVVAFNSWSTVVRGLDRLSPENRTILENSVKSLIFTGGTRIAEGIKAARQLLAKEAGSNSIILFSDGQESGEGDDIQAAGVAARQGTRIYAIGVGKGTNEAHMQEIASAGNGFYLKPTEAQRLKIILNSGGLEKLSNIHFITRNVLLNARISGFNQVVPKSNADVLVATGEGRPVLTVWRLGLGKVVAISTDDGKGWASELLNRDNSVLLSRAVNWAIGDLGRNKQVDVSVRDTFLGDYFGIEVISNRMPEDNRLEFAKTGERAYSTEFRPESAGWHSFFDAAAAVNYPLELYNLGYDAELETLVKSTGGGIFTPEQKDALADKVRQDSRMLVTSRKSLAWLPLAAALVAFLAEIAIRRAWERNEKKTL
ncbi:TPA: VWA domain-containing protein [Candidatus Woesearchaeota archaeon]|nr:VWA domain-containing protein [Candidatus Woesearchaeota archaeon]